MKISERLINDVWEKGRRVKGVDPTKYRKDACGAWIAKNQFGKNSPMGWVIDHIKPQIKKGSDDITNLRPFHFLNNISKGSDFPSYIASVVAEGNENIKRIRSCRVNAKALALLESNKEKIK